MRAVRVYETAPVFLEDVNGPAAGFLAAGPSVQAPIESLELGEDRLP